MGKCNDEPRGCTVKILDYGIFGVGPVFTDDEQPPPDEPEKQRPPEGPVAVPPDGGE